ncbi:unnamed protein product [Kuraishia capsulata CBS 1993]|uniref:Choline/carnitine acyltransferase domain-containing protein n=1 Tax=Kuraishia capsulata CBS 1993 TaxID=1382522 RepID=W6MN27_9ASCO|nr:uncharacterized protein KUCA_T00003627001 [Kuraishia capsulata CBS 1993]CDK27648.1 unnamed protein product [Kuraishia capsulata CBS 1993]
MTTFEYQKSLKKLPIPPLGDTCRRYLEVLRPLQTETEHAKTVAAVTDFIKGAGPVLDEQLKEYSKTRDSYIEQFWYDSYLNYDSPVVLNLNPFILLEDDPTPLQSTQLSRAASLTTSSLRFVRALRRNELGPDRLKNGAPLDMDQYPKLFGSARIPSRTGCVLQTDSFSRHIVVLSRSQFYWFDVLDGDDDLIMTETDIRLNFKSILEDAESAPITEIARSSFGVLTTENRKLWAGLRERLGDDKANDEILKIIDGALFVVCLDNVEVENLKDLAKNCLCGLSVLEKGVQVGTCTNRWYDKLQLIVTKNAKAGINFEHTGVDGHTVLRFASDIYTDSILRFAKSINSNAPSLWKSFSPDPSTRDPASFGDVITTPRKLEWNLTNELSLALRFGETRLSDLIQQNEFAALEFKDYGMERIKKMGMSPDAFVQMCFQATYFALYGKVECTYEPAMTKMFLHGRTEAIRTVSMESNEFVTKFFESNVSSSEKVRLLKAACSAHSARTRDCSKGLGQDRHLYALFCIWKRYFNEESESEEFESDATTVNFDSPVDLREIPAIFADPGWDKLNNTILSTSNCGNPSLKLFGFGPVSPNGFGIGYIIKDNSISICASSKHRQTRRLLDTLNGFLVEVEKIYRDSIAPEVSNEAKFADALRGRLLRVNSPHASRDLAGLLGGYDSLELNGNSDFIKSRGNSPEPPFLRPGLKYGFSSREIGKKLRLSEY